MATAVTSGIVAVVASLPLSAHANTGWKCEAQCVAVDVAKQTVQHLGSVVSSTAPDRFEAWTSLDRRCRKVAKKNGFDETATPLLLSGVQIETDAKDTQTQTGSHSSSSSVSQAGAASKFQRGRRVRYASAAGAQSASSSASGAYFHTFTTEDHFRIELRYANPSEACGSVEIDPNAVPQYEGDEPVLG